MKWILDQLFMENGKCPICKRVLFFTADHVCPLCMERLESPEFLLCARCGRKKSQDRLKICLDCLVDPPAFQQGSCGFHYDASGKELVYAMKFKARPGLCRFAGAWMAGVLEKRYGKERFAHIEGVIPVPLHEDTWKSRGYNQSEELALGLLSRGNLWKGKKPPVISGVLVKSGEGLHQRELGKQERRAHAEKIFQI